MKIGILNIATGNYRHYFPNLYYTMKKRFLPDHEKHFFYFTDFPENFPADVNVITIERKGFPGDTLYRYHYFDDIKPHLEKMDVLYYIDVDAYVNLSVGDEDQAVPAYVQALLEQTADSLEKLQGTLERGEQSQILANNSVIVLSEKLDTFTDQMQTEKSLITKLVETQIEIKNLITKLLETAETKSDENAQSAVRNIDKQLSRLIEQIGAGRTELISEMRSEIRVLARTMAAIAEQA